MQTGLNLSFYCLLETKLDFSGQGPYLYVNQFQAFINHIQFKQFRFNSRNIDYGEVAHSLLHVISLTSDLGCSAGTKLAQNFREK